ncbi:hypothetical protein [Leisingera sp. ANG-M1]|uniref:hypothetical protein n=1 Tax=Leisingera sp. ANG-M1 TaxID=1577895 RepID=UPI00068C1286|nr:hypothetical protein [Leisingera sp. ANG-M1]
MNWNDLLPLFMPYLLEAVGLVLASLIGAAAMAAKKRFGIEIEAKHREALHSALMTGLQAALRHKASAGREAIIEAAISYAGNSVPDALNALRPENAVLRNIARAKLEQILPEPQS